MYLAIQAQFNERFQIRTFPDQEKMCDFLSAIRPANRCNYFYPFIGAKVDAPVAVVVNEFGKTHIMPFDDYDSAYAYVKKEYDRSQALCDRAICELDLTIYENWRKAHDLMNSDLQKAGAVCIWPDRARFYRTEMRIILEDGSHDECPDFFHFDPDYTDTYDFFEDGFAEWVTTESRWAKMKSASQL